MTEQSAHSFKLWGLSISTNKDGLLFMLAYRFIPLDKRIIILDVMLDGFNFLLTCLSPNIIVRLKIHVGSVGWGTDLTYCPHLLISSCRKIFINATLTLPLIAALPKMHSPNNRFFSLTCRSRILQSYILL
jgi:hypothetical protein